MLLLLACTPPDADTGEPVDLVTLVTNPGPHHVGYQESSLTYGNAAAGEDRTLRLAAWYPTDDDSGPEASYFNGSIPAKGVIDGAEITKDTHPLAVFSHGHQGYAESTAFLMEHLATHGWVVLAPDHTGNTTLDGDNRTTAIYHQRPRDITAVIDAAPDLGFSVTSDNVFAMGHSFGGYTMFALAGGRYDTSMCPSTASSFCSTWSDDQAAMFNAGFLDERIAAFVAMAPGDGTLFFDDGLTGLGPMLHMTATEDQGPGSEADLIWPQLADGTNRRVILDGAGHLSFTMFADQMEDVTMDRDEGFRIIDGYVLAWAWASQGDARGRALLDGEDAISEDASVQR